MGAIGMEPSIVGVETGLLEIEVGMVADQHADGRVDDLGGDPVPVLILQAGGGIPAAAVQILEPRAPDPDVLGRNPGRRDQAHGHGRLHAIYDVDIPHAVVAHDVRRPITVRRVDMAAVTVGRLGNMRICGNRAPVHPFLHFRCRRVGRRWKARQVAELSPFRPAGAVEPLRTVWHTRAARCRSSVVEHPLGKGEVHSSILCGSTSASSLTYREIEAHLRWRVKAVRDGATR